jgi:DNA (cytosine-5)-methyltransferase 1
MKFLTLFAGAGGADIGLSAAGIEHVRCVEYDENAAATGRAAGFPVITGDVRDPRVYRDLPRIDGLWASPPCQDWSSAGKRKGANGDRNGWPWTWAVIDHLRRRGLGPDWFIAENVPGMLTHNGKACGSGCCADPLLCARTYFLEVVMAEARKRFAWADWRILDAASYGVPQFRKRVILVAGPRPIEWPEPTHGEPTKQVGLFGAKRKSWVTVRDALGLDGVLDPGVWIRTESTGNLAHPDTTPIATVSANGNQYVHETDPGARPQKGGSSGRRRLTIEECARLQDFPDDYPWHGTKTSVYRQIGNAVPPTLARVLGDSVMAKWGER